MATVSLDEKIRKQTAHLDSLETQLSDELGQHLAGWYRETAETCVVNEPDQAKAIGDRLSTLKKEIDAAADGMRDQVRAALKAASHLWPHRTGQNTDGLGVGPKNVMPSAYIEALQPLSSELLVRTFGRYGFNVPRIPLEFSAESIATALDYASGVAKLRLLEHQLSEASNKKKKKEALDLWRKA